MDIAAIDAKIEALKAERSEIDRKIDAYLLVRQDLAGLPISIGIRVPSAPKQKFAGRSGKKSSKVRDWVFAQQGEFSLVTAAEWFAVNDPEVTRKDISFVLYSLAKDGKIMTKRQGTANAAAVYENSPV